MGRTTTRGSRGQVGDTHENQLSLNSCLATGHLRELRVEVMALAELKPCQRNPRTHSAKQIRQIAASMRQFGFTNPVLIGGDGDVIAGHGRLAAAKLLGLERVPTIRLADMSEAQKRAYVLADNKLAENAGWDRELLALELQYLAQLDLDFDFATIGFDTAEVDLLLDDGGDDEPAQVDEAGPAVSRAGDLWVLGRHRVLCADANRAESLQHLMGDKLAQMVFVDPPYNVPIAGHAGGSGAVQHREFAMAAGEMSEGEFTVFLSTIFGHLCRHSCDGAIHFVCMDWRHIFEVLSAGRATYSELKNLCVWRKDNAGMGSLYRSQYELIFVFKHGTASHINNIELGRFGRNRTNVWDYPGANSLREGRLEELAMHPTVKPLALVADAIRDCSKRGGAILDSFGGSGTTLMAAEKTGRRAFVMELDPVYVDVTIRRFERVSREIVIHAASGRNFAELARQRALETSAVPPTTEPRKGETDGD